MVGGSASGWTPTGPALIGEQMPGENISNIYSLPSRLKKRKKKRKKDKVNQVQNVEIKVQELIMAPSKFTSFYQRVNYYMSSNGNVFEANGKVH